MITQQSGGNFCSMNIPNVVICIYVLQMNGRPGYQNEEKPFSCCFFLKVMSESIYLENVEASAFEVMNATLKASDSKSLPFRAPTCPSCHRPHHLFSSCCYEQH